MTTAVRTRRHLTITGIVQGVGFRPHVHRLATELGLVGHVGNDAACVFVEVEGPASHVEAFAVRVLAEAPPLARVLELRTQHRAPTGEASFRIVASSVGGPVVPATPPDTATCAACLAELHDPTDRRYRHPFITCTDCGPRFTIITALPYDRPSTTMAAFVLCDCCEAEYHDPLDRRFHAQPVACHQCGPTLRFERDGELVAGAGRLASDAALAAAQGALADGAIVAVKGIGGYHLACRADDDGVVMRLRTRKQRPGKALAVLVADLDAARALAHVDDEEAALLASAAAPIVLLRRRDEAPLAPSVAPGNPLVGVLLASNPLHHLLLAPVPGSDVRPLAAVVLTSGNRSEEPLCVDDDEARERLADLADAWLWHDRPIAVPCDDSVVRMLDDGPSLVRRSRGYVPTPVLLPAGVSGTTPVLALGAELKATTCLIQGRMAWLSQHLGDMGSLATLRALETTVARTETLHGVRPQVLACDLHPDHTAHRWALREADGRTVEPVQHHHAHVAAAMAEHGLVGPVLGIAFDGTGLGTDGTIWGGEVLRADLLDAVRVAHLSATLLPGGDAAIRHPRRVALSHLWSAGVPWDEDLPCVTATPPHERALLATQLERSLQTVPTTSAGRLFDAVASLLGVRHDVTYEAQAAIELEALADAHARAAGEPAQLALPLRAGVWDCGVLMRGLVAGLRAGLAPGALALGFHLAVAAAVVEVAVAERDETGIATVVLTGGVFGNALLTRLTTDALRAADLRPLRHHLVPPNDGGISLGQALVAAARHARDHRTNHPVS